MSSFPEILLRRANAVAPLKILWRDESAQIVMLHDSDKALQTIAPLLEAAGADVLNSAYFICNYSQHITLDRARRLGAIWSAILAAMKPPSRAVLERNVLFLMNSENEIKNFREIFPQSQVALVSNNFTLNEALLAPPAPGAPKIYDAVFNAKPYDFKRHHLAAQVENMALISYSEHRAKAENRHFDIRTLPHAHIAWCVPEAEVARLIGASYCGLALSASEGACYASTEYLLCGAPVVSTPCVGGREEYYTPENALVVAAEPEAVAAAVKTWIARFERGEVKPERIREDAVARQRRYRRTFAAHVAHLTGLDEDAVFAHVSALIASDNKLNAHVNYWVGDGEAVRAAPAPVG